MTDARKDVRDQVAARYAAAADELERRARHLRIAARHDYDREIPRGRAHAWAVHGHVRMATTWMDDNAVLQASKAST